MWDAETADAEQLTRLILDKKDQVYLDALSNPNLHDDHVLLILRDDAVPLTVIKAIHDHQVLISKYMIKAAMVNNPRTPKVTALNLVKYLFWRDLVKVSHNIKLLTAVRYAAELNLKDRLFEITLGEKISLARICSREIVKELRFETNEMIFKALLSNPLLTEEDLAVTISKPKTPAVILQLIAQHEKWLSRYPIRLSLLRNPRTPVPVSLSLLTGLLEKDLKAVVHQPGLPTIVRHGAQRALEAKRARGLRRP